MVYPDGLGATARSQALVEPADLWATLLGWWQLPIDPPPPTAYDLTPVVREEVLAVRDRICLVHPAGQQAIRTPAWYLRTTESLEEGEGWELYVKPDDRWEVNNVADRCPEVADALKQAFEQTGQHLQTGRLADLPPLEEILRVGIEFRRKTQHVSLSKQKALGENNRRFGLVMIQPSAEMPRFSRQNRDFLGKTAKNIIPSQAEIQATGKRLLRYSAPTDAAHPETWTAACAAVTTDGPPSQWISFTRRKWYLY
jgi:hypothetical protein